MGDRHRKTPERKEKVKEAVKRYKLRKKFGEEVAPKKFSYNPKGKTKTSIAYDCFGKPRVMGRTYKDILKDSNIKIIKEEWGEV